MALPLAGRGEETAPLQLSADRTEFFEQANETALTGRAEMREADLLVTADEFRFKGQTGDNPESITARGHVVYTRKTLRILADRVVLHRQDRSFTAEHIRLGSFPYYISGESAKGSREEVTVYKAHITYGEPGPWQPTATADEITVGANGRRIRSNQAQVGIGHIQPLPFPKFQQNLSDPLWAFVTVTGGYRGSLGAYIDGGLHLPVAPGIRIGGDLGYYTARGLLLGPSGSYSDASDPDRMRGAFRSGYINDHGDKKTDVLGRAISEDRGFVEWEHQQWLTEDISLAAQLNWWKDSEVVRDFRPRRFFPVQQPDTFVEVAKTNPNSFVSLFARFAPNSFEIVQERLPELRFDLLPVKVGDGFLARLNASVVALREQPLPVSTAQLLATTATQATGSSADASSTWTAVSPLPLGARQALRSARFDTYVSLSRPFVPETWFALTPVAGGRVTHYTDTRGPLAQGDTTRWLGELGFDAELRSNGTFAYKNEAWHIDGLRHLFTPRVSYRYIPESRHGSGAIPLVDRQTFSTYLPPLGLGDARNLDDLHETNTLRLSFDNTLQARDPQRGPRDLLVFNVANDFRFHRQRGEKDVSEVHTELAAMPTRWLEFGFYNRIAPQSLSLREFNAGVTLHDGDAWSVRFANNFLRHQLEDYVLDGRARLNEEYDVLAQLRYDQRKHRFTEQAYGIVQNLGNTWRISYLVSLYSGRRRESSFGFSVQIDTVRF